MFNGASTYEAYTHAPIVVTPCLFRYSYVDSKRKHKASNYAQCEDRREHIGCVSYQFHGYASEVGRTGGSQKESVTAVRYGPRIE